MKKLEEKQMLKEEIKGKVHIGKDGKTKKSHEIIRITGTKG
jgi:hypothetical protein